MRSRQQSSIALVVCLLLAVLIALAPPGPSASADAAATKKLTIAMADGTELVATLTGQAPLRARPTVVEFTPYGNSGASYAPSSDYNYLVVQLRGTGSSDGVFDALGPQSQRDVAASLRWACDQSFSNGDLAVAGFSASAIIIFNSLHLRLPCVKAAVLRSGTFELYRDLLVPGGITNIVPGAAVIGMIGAPELLQGADRITDPTSAIGVLFGMVNAGLNAGFLHPSLDSWWRQRGFRGNVNRIPTLFLDGAYDVEPRGDYQGFQQLRSQHIPAKLLVVGAHDGAPAGTDFGVAQIDSWLDHYLRGIDNGTDREPAVQMLMPKGDREQLAFGSYQRYVAGDWPVPKTRWTALALSAAKSGAATSINDGSLALKQPKASTTQAYPAVTDLPFSTDPNTIATVSGGSVNEMTQYLPFLTNMDLANSVGLTYSSPVLNRALTVAGPGSLDLRLATAAPTTNIWAVVSDVWPDGSAHPIAVGRLNSNYPGVVKAKSLVRNGAIVQPYGDYSTVKTATPGVARDYHVEIWPILNRFGKGHRIQLSIVGQSALSMPGVPGLNLVTVGGAKGSRLMFPTLPGNRLGAAFASR